MVKINRTVLHDTVPTLHDFSTGAVLRTSNDLMKFDNDLLIWSGDFPKYVEAGSTPESTGGVSPNGWVYLTNRNSEVIDELQKDVQSNTNAITNLNTNTWLAVFKYYGVVGDGIADDTTPFTKVLNAGFSSVHIPSNLTIKFEGSITVNKNTLITGGVIVGGEVNFVDGGGFRSTHLNNTCVRFYTKQVKDFNSKNPIMFENCTGQDCCIVIGEDASSVRTVSIVGNQFKCNNHSKIFCTLVNTSNFKYSHNITQGYSRPLEVRSTRSFVSVIGEVSYNNEIAYGFYKYTGSGIGRISSVHTHHNVFSVLGASDTSPIIDTIVDYCSKLVYDNNTVQTQGTMILQNTRYLVLNQNEFTSGHTQSGFRLYSIKGGVVKDNTFNYNNNSRDYLLLSISGTNNQLERSEDLVVSGNTFSTRTRQIAVAGGTQDAVFRDNTFITTEPSSAYPDIDGSSAGEGVYAYMNLRVNNGGNPFTTGSVSTTPWSNNSVPGYHFINKDVSLVHSGPDTAFGGSLTYIVEVPWNSIRSLRSIQRKDAKGKAEFKTVPEWMSGVGAKFAINMSAFDADISEYYACTSNGSAIMCSSGEFYFRPSAGCINRFGELTVRDWTLLGDTGTGYEGYRTPMRNLLNGMVSEGIQHSLIFRAPLVLNGAVYDYESTGIIDSGSFNTKEPRMSVGQKLNGDLVFICVDGRNSTSVGASMLELANKFISLGCVTAFNTDGGGSATMMFNGEVINTPSDGAPRAVANVLYMPA